MAIAGSGPTWTRARLDRVLRLRFGASRGRVDTQAVADQMGVSRRTVQRWLHARTGRSVAHIPGRRLDQLIGLLLPDPDTLAREAQRAVYATTAIDQIRRDPVLGVKPAWVKQRWLEDHVVAVIDVRVHDQRLRQLVTARAETAKIQEIRRRGTILDQASVATRFHAMLLVHQVLTDLAPWRYQASPSQVVQGFTQTWLADAPFTDLARTLGHIEDQLHPVATTGDAGSDRAGQ